MGKYVILLTAAALAVLGSSAIFTHTSQASSGLYFTTRRMGFQDFVSLFNMTQNSVAQMTSTVSNSSKISIINDIPHDGNIVLILPVFTQAAYSPHGFYWFYSGRCNLKCLTVPIQENFTDSYVTGGGLDDVLLDQNFAHVTDIDVDKDPAILNKYDKVILLHNEYVTQREFDAITHHHDVIYLYPNALYARVKVDYDKNTITLVRGHGYPQKDIRNGFGWAFDNSKYEYNTACENWQFYKIKNGYMLDCYPQLALENDNLMLEKMRLL